MGRRARLVESDEVETLRNKLEVAELKREVLELQKKNESLQSVIDQQCNIIKENTTLLRRQRLPPRPYLNSTAKALLAQSQGWRCANPNGDCPLFKLGDGRFGRDLWEVDHIAMWSRSGQHTGNLRSLCSFCHAVVTRQQISQQRIDESERDSNLSGGD
jgi:hypothetical protein